MGIGNDLIGDLEQLLVRRALERKALFRMIGSESQAWRAEREIEGTYPGMHCLLLPSATVGLSLLLELLDLKPGQEVVIAPFGWVSNWSCLITAGLGPRFVPLDDDLQLRAEDVATRINERTGAVIVTHLQGRGQQAVAEIATLCSERGIPLLEDVAQSFGVSVGGRRIGTFGTAAWSSLNHHKILSTGDGGFLLVRDAALFELASARHDQGNVMSMGKRTRPQTIEPGLSLRVNELTAAVLRAQLARYPLVRQRILRLHRALSAELKQRALQLLSANDGDVPFTVILRRPEGATYPSLAESGWHNAANVPWLAATVGRTAADDPSIGRTLETLAAVAAVGAGFVDKYYGIPLGLAITDDPVRAAGLATTVEGMM